MNPLLVFCSYALAGILAISILHQCGAVAWYWHVLSIATAFAIGFFPLQPDWIRPSLDLSLGFSFTFLFLWGVCGLLVHAHHWTAQHSHHHV